MDSAYGVGDARASRRSLLLGAAVGVVGAVGTHRPAAAAPSYAVVPRLPGELSRTDTRTTRVGRRPYECVDVGVPGDRARIFVPHTAPPSLRVARAAVWFYHSNGSTHTALDGAYRYAAELAVDRGAICVCPGYGGPSTWTNATARGLQPVWSRYLTSVWKVATSFARSNSGGGPLMIWAYGQRLLPWQRGMYLANAAYDMEDLYARDPARIGPPYGNDPAAIREANPARLSAASWTGTRLKTVVSAVDVVVPPARHGLALAGRARPVAADVRVQHHAEGHVVPGWTASDMIATFAAWL